MKKFVAVTQVSSSKFKVEYINAETISRVKTNGILISVWESNSKNDKYCINLANEMNNK